MVQLDPTFLLTFALERHMRQGTRCIQQGRSDLRLFRQSFKLCVFDGPGLYLLVFSYVPLGHITVVVHDW